MKDKAFGTCPLCKEWGQLWKVTRLVKRFWLFGPLVPHAEWRCDECESKPYPNSPPTAGACWHWHN